MTLPAPLPHTPGQPADARDLEPPARALRLALDRRHPSCSDVPAGVPCQALASCPLAPACAPAEAPPLAPRGGDVVVALPPPVDNLAYRDVVHHLAPPVDDHAKGDMAHRLAPRADGGAGVVVPLSQRAESRGGGEAGEAGTAGPARRRRTVAALRRRNDRGQATAEYGLVILVAGLIALGVIAWARGTGSFTDLFEGVIDSLTAGL